MVLSRVFLPMRIGFSSLFFVKFLFLLASNLIRKRNHFPNKKYIPSVTRKKKKGPTSL